MKRAQAFVLPIEDLAKVASDAGMVWVNSDPERIAAAQASIAAEPPQIHIPRERPARVELNEGPLVLVETRRDLANMQLPFDTNGGSVSQQVNA
jgi:ribonuclease E